MKKDPARNTTLLARVRRAIKRADAQARVRIRLAQFNFAQWLVRGKKVEEIDTQTAIFNVTDEIVNQRRRQIFATLLATGCLLPAMADQASAATQFTNFSFAAAGGITPRTMPTRLSEVRNVKDFGAIGDGRGDALSTRYGSLAAAQAVYPFVTSLTQTIDYAAEQAAVNSVAVPGIITPTGAGTVFHPPGVFVLNTSVDLGPAFTSVNGNNSIHLLGVAGASRIQGTFGDWLIHNSLDNGPFGSCGSVTNLAFSNPHASGGCLNPGSVIAWTIQNCSFSGNCCLDFYDVGGHASQSVSIIGCLFTSGGLTGNSIGILVGEGTAVIGCDITGLKYGIVSKIGLSVNACRFEVNTVGITLGGARTFGSALPPTAIIQSNGWGQTAVTSSTFESCLTAIDCLGAGGAAIFSGLGIHGGMDYGIRTRGQLHDATFIAVNVGGGQNVAGIQLGRGSSDPINVTFINTNTSNNGPPSWVLDSNVNAADYKFISCNYNPVWTFAKLPTTTQKQGEQYFITDANTSTLGANVTAGGGSTNGYVVWNGANWTLMSK